MINYLFQDVFYKFKELFDTYENIESKFLYDVAFGFMPRKFDENVIIYDEGDDVPEVYFIMEGTIRVGFRTPTLNYTDFRLIKYFREDSFVCNFYVYANRKVSLYINQLKK